MKTWGYLGERSEGHFGEEGPDSWLEVVLEKNRAGVSCLDSSLDHVVEVETD